MYLLRLIEIVFIFHMKALFIKRGYIQKQILEMKYSWIILYLQILPVIRMKTILMTITLPSASRIVISNCTTFKICFWTFLITFPLQAVLEQVRGNLTWIWTMSCMFTVPTSFLSRVFVLYVAIKVNVTMIKKSFFYLCIACRFRRDTIDFGMKSTDWTAADPCGNEYISSNYIKR